MVVIQELIKRSDGSVCGLGNTYEVSDGEAQTRVAAGEAKYLDRALGSSERKTKKKKETLTGEQEIDG